jgi:hypothetical protein
MTFPFPVCNFLKCAHQVVEDCLIDPPPVLAIDTPSYIGHLVDNRTFDRSPSRGIKLARVKA